MNKQALEVLVLAAVDRVMKGRKTEDSLVECKREWPEVSKARQLAGHANSARGEEIVWIIGIDEKTGELTNPEMPDLAEWWSQMSSRFDDQVAPEMQSLNIQVNEHASVTALAFITDRAPYVVKTGSDEGRAEREVPFRDGTRTRSARRHELLRLLRPAAVPPPASILSASLTGTALPSSVQFDLDTVVFIEQHADQTVMLPWHRMECRIVPTGAEDREVPLSVNLSILPGMYEQDFANIGVQQRRDGLIVSGPAAISFFGILPLTGANYRDYGDVRVFEISIKMSIAGGERPIAINERLRFEDLVSPAQAQPQFGKWSFPAAASASALLAEARAGAGVSMEVRLRSQRAAATCAPRDGPVVTVRKWHPGGRATQARLPRRPG